RGCVVTANADLIDIAKYIELNRTSIVVVHNLSFLKRDTWESEREKILGMVNKWAMAWQLEDINSYLASYDQKQFFDDNRGNYQEFSRYKKAVFQAPGTPEVELKNLSIMMANGYAVVSFIQDYKASNLS